MKLAIGIIFYNDCRSLDRALNSTKEFDKVICVDGRFKNYIGETQLSNDGSRELIQQYQNTILIDAPNLIEPDKRSTYLKLCTSDFLIYLDSDEWVEGNINEFRDNLHKYTQQNEHIYSLPFYSKAGGGYSVAPRIYQRPNKIRYGQLHFSIIIDGIEYKIRGNNWKQIKGITIHTDDDLRTKEHTLASNEYKTWLNTFEHPIKEMIRNII